MDDLTCDTCGKTFNTNAGLYTHQQNKHNNPSVILVNHNRHRGDHWRPSKRKREPSKRKRDPESEFDKFVYPPKKRRYDEDDTGLEVIDEVDDDTDSELDDDLEIIDEYDRPPDVLSDDDEDDDLPPPSNPVQPSIPSSQLNYRKLYEKCRQNYNKMKSRCKNKLEALNRKHKAHLKRKLDELNDKYDADIVDIRERFRKQMNELEQAKTFEINDRVTGIQNEHQATIERMGIEYQAKMAELDAECEDKIKTLKTHIKDLQDESEEFTSLSKAIFNCTTIEEIFEIDRLVKNHRLDVVAQKHLKTLQNLFLSLSYGILPLCDAQRKMVTPKQRELVDKIQSSSGVTAKRYLKENHNEVVNLFTVIHDSLKLMRNTFNRYGTLNDV